VRYITNQPELGVKRLFGELAGSTVNEGSQAGWAKLGANVPLGQKAALRVAGYYNRLAGYIDAVQPDLSVNEDVNTGYRSGVRAANRLYAFSASVSRSARNASSPTRSSASTPWRSLGQRDTWWRARAA
jgi:hypothetical protein